MNRSDMSIIRANWQAILVVLLLLCGIAYFSWQATRFSFEVATVRVVEDGEVKLERALSAQELSRLAELLNDARASVGPIYADHGPTYVGFELDGNTYRSPFDDRIEHDDPEAGVRTTYRLRGSAFYALSEDLKEFSVGPKGD